MASLMQNECETDNRKAMRFSSTTLALQARVECLFIRLFINLLHNSIFTLLTMD